MKACKLFLLICGAVSLSGCAPEYQGRCPSEWSNESSLDADLPKSAIVQHPRFKAETIATVQRCYSRQPYADDPQYELYFGQERVLPDGSRILVFSISGVSDVEFGVVLKPDETIDRAGLVSLNF